MDMKIYPDPNQSQPNQNNGNGNPPAGGGVRPPPPPPVTIRTMDSDVKSVEESGGGKPQGETLNLPRAPITPPPVKKPDESRVQVPGYGGPEKKMFGPEKFPQKPPGAPADGSAPKKSSMKNIFIIVLLLVAASAIGAIGYFYVYPYFLGDAPEETAGPTPPPAPAPAPTPPPPTIAHTSYIQSDIAQAATSLSAASAEEVPPGTVLVKEVPIVGADGNPRMLSDYLPAILSEFSQSELKEYFDDDFTAFIYYDDAGAWAGHVFRRKAGVPQLAADQIWRKIESSTNLNGLFLADPGAQSGEWKSGSYEGASTRYLVYESGTALNYAWVGDKLVLVTYFPALQALIDGRLAAE